jgi:hypothetical protein
MRNTIIFPHTGQFGTVSPRFIRRIGAVSPIFVAAN